MHAQEFCVRRGGRIYPGQQVHALARNEVVLKVREACRTLRVPEAHVVEQAVGMCDEVHGGKRYNQTSAWPYMMPPVFPETLSTTLRIEYIRHLAGSPRPDVDSPAHACARIRDNGRQPAERFRAAGKLQVAD